MLCKTRAGHLETFVVVAIGGREGERNGHFFHHLLFSLSLPHDPRLFFWG